MAPDDGPKRRFAQEMADRLEAFLDGRRMSYADAGHGMGVNPNALRYAAPTGRVLIRWEGARRPIIWTVPAPDVDPREARLELARRYLHVIGPGTAAGFVAWAGIPPPIAQTAFDALRAELVGVRTPIGDGWIVADDEGSFRSTAAERPAPARLLPSGDAFYLLQGRDRALLVEDPHRRAELWTSRVWPGALLVDGEVAGIWRRADATVAIEPWRRLTRAERETVEAEAASLPLPGIAASLRVRWLA